MTRMTSTTSGYGNRQRGVFAVEFALVAGVICLFLIFISDVVIKQNIQGNLQRLSYSGVNIIKERTQLYSEPNDHGDVVVLPLNNGQFDELQMILTSSLARTMAGYKKENLGIYIEQVVLQKKQCEENDKPDDCYEELYSHSQTGNAVEGKCQPATPLKNMNELYFKTNLNKSPALYQVTLCYQTSDWFGGYVGEEYNGLVRASSVMMGR